MTIGEKERQRIAMREASLARPSKVKREVVPHKSVSVESGPDKATLPETVSDPGADSPEHFVACVAAATASPEDIALGLKLLARRRKHQSDYQRRRREKVKKLLAKDRS